MRDLIIGIDLGGTSTKMAVIKNNGDIIQKWTIPTIKDADGVKIIPDIIHSIKRQIEKMAIKQANIIGIGMGAPGAINRKDGTVSGAYNLNWITEQSIKSVFEQTFDVPFFIDNDANVAALGEKWRGSGEDVDNVVFITLGTGVGGGIIVANRLVTGKHGCAGEIGHLHVTDNPVFQCTCGNQGCLESVASANGMIHLTKELARNYEAENELKQKILIGTEITVKELFDAAKQKNPFALSVVQTFSRYIGIACSHITNLLDPGKIIIGGGIAEAGDILLEAISENYNSYVFPKSRDNQILALASLGNDAGVLGAAYLVIENEKG